MDNIKTLVGKNNWLFLINDGSNTLEIHNNNLCVVNKNSCNKYKSLLHNNKILLVIFPNKEYVCKEFLPDKYNLQYRPGFNVYKSIFQNNILDGLPFVNKGDYYKTDTHINLQGAYKIYKNTILKLNNQFKFNLSIKDVCLDSIKTELSKLNIGIGDLTWDINKGNLVLDNINDKFYSSLDIIPLYCKYKIQDQNIYNLQILDYELNNVTHKLNGEILSWVNVVSNKIIHTTLSKNECNNKLKVLIFYDSFLLSTLSLWIETFHEVYLIKNTFDISFYNKIQPDFVLEFRVERFLR
jgi:hypothetical protein